jgi:O6-methylguanine-DNA--protein-cysteine methyltransferase
MPRAMAKRQVPLSAASAAVSPKRHKTLTSHCLRVYALCKRVPRGRFTTYGRLAAAAGSSAR